MSHFVHNPSSLPAQAVGTQSHPAPSSQGQPVHNSSNDSQATTTSTLTDNDRIFTPPESDSEGSNRHRNHYQSSSQESQLMQLSNLAALQQKIVVSRDDADFSGVHSSRKRTAGGAVKHARQHSSASPVRMGHSRNTSAVSVASTTGSRIGELSAELRTKLSYAMVKVNNGWQSHSIDEVESLASRAASPASSTSTLHGRHGSSGSPRLPVAGLRQTASNPSSMATSPVVQHPQGRTYDSFWRENAYKVPSGTSPVSHAQTLAPPAPIQPRQSGLTHPRRSSHAKHTPAYLSQSYHTSPHTPSQPNPLQNTPGHRPIHTSTVDPVFSPPQNLREQEALETLIFMSSPGNSANLKHTFPPAPTSSLRTSSRTALPTSRLGQTSEASSQGRRALPTGRPQTQQPKRVEFEKSPSAASAMEVDEPYGSSQIRTTPRRKTIHGSVPRPSLSVPAGLSGPAKPKPPLGDDDIQRMIDRAAAAESSDSEGEIQLPPSSRRNGTGVGA
ncbi:hypothetical protein GGS21DRAFT_368467 [Xylaria nigripes]|nr:hypothetical protein GGS21DRAFT_368467 [Xylaria nigripes]